MKRLVMVAALLAATTAACKKGGSDAGPPCDQVVDHMQLLMKQMMPGHDPAALGNRQQMIDQCVQRKMPADVRRCILAATSFNDLSTCRKKAPTATTTTPTPPPTQPAGTTPPEPAPGTPTPAAGSDAGSAAGSGT